MKRKPAKSEIQNFEVSLEKLKTIVSQLENGKLTLSESLQRYEEGIKSLKQCHEALNIAQMKIEQLVRLDENGRLITKPFDDTASFENVPSKPTSESRYSDPENPVDSEGDAVASKGSDESENEDEDLGIDELLDANEVWEDDPIPRTSLESGPSKPSSTPGRRIAKGKPDPAADRFLNFDDDA